MTTPFTGKLKGDGQITEQVRASGKTRRSKADAPHPLTEARYLDWQNSKDKSQP